MLVLVIAGVAMRTCASQDRNVSQEEAVEIAIDAVGFEPCPETLCQQVRYLQQGIPVRGYWLVGLARALDENGEPVGARSVLVDVATGEVSRP